MKEVCGAISHKMDKLMRKHQVDGTELFIYFYIHVHVHVYILPYLLWSKMIYIFRFISTMYCTNFLCKFYSNSHFLVYFLEFFFSLFCFKIIVFHSI